MLAPCPSSFSSFLLPHQPFYCWTRSVWTLQEQPSRLSTPSHLQQEVAQAAACNSAQDFVWVTYIMAPQKKATVTAHFYFFLLVSLSAYFFPVPNIIYFSRHFRCMWGKKYCIRLQNGKLDVSVAHVVSPHLKYFSLICQNCNHVKAM